MGDKGGFECRICGNTENNIPYQVSEMMFGTGEMFSYFQCSNCECLQIEEVPENLAKFYPTNYYSFNSNKIIEKAKMLQSRYQFSGRGFLGRLLSCIIPSGKKTIYDFLSDELSNGRITMESRILDIGTGNGELLNLLASLGFKNLTGIDPFMVGSTTRENGVKLIKSSVAELEGKFDIIMFNHSFEHIFEQKEAMKAINDLLTDNGACLIRMPVVSSYAWEHYGVNWCHIEAPRHFFLHSVKSMDVLCKNNGFNVTDTEWDSGESQFIGSERHIQGKGLLKFPHTITYRLVHYFKVRGYRKKAKELNMNKKGDQACFIIRKNVQD